MNLRTALESLWTVRLFLLAAGVAGLVVGLGTRASIGALEGQLSVDCDGTGSQVVAGCQYGEQQAFTVAIHAVGAPAAGYPAFQAKLRWDGAVLDYRPSSIPSDEVVWPSCDIPARFDNRPGDTSVLLGCSSFPIDESNYAGALLQLDFACIAPGTSQLTLVAREGDAQNGSHFIALDDSDAQIIIDPTLTGATVTCGGADIDTPTAEPTASATPPSSTPVPSATLESPATMTPVPSATLGSPATMTPVPSATLGSPATWTPMPTWTPAPTWTPVLPAPDTPTSTPAAPTAVSALGGDTNCDGAVDAADATFILQFWAALISALPCPDAADADGDGQDSLVDATIILQFAAGFLDSLPP